ncbi:MAG: PASTA domain-containing protein [Ilumatobacteraceae bacterium]|nr:PASTA domain-containing protein [Ilumatobacteraceae bacterium]
MSTSASPPGGPTEPSDLLGRVVADHLVLARVVSAGANATVFDASDETTGRTVTVKLIQPGMAAPEAFQQRFDETMRRVGALSHPNIAALYDWGTTEIDGQTTWYVVVEQLTGGSLRDMFDRARRLSPSQALAIGLDACRALDYAHRRGFVHTELTPSKLVFGDDRRLRITDFGLAALLNESTWEQPDAVATHTAWYASPEQGLAQPIDGKTDVYALCLTLHEAVTGVLPFKNDSTVAALAARVGRLMPVSADLGPLASVLEHAGRPEADERSSAAQFGKELVQVASKLPRPEPLPLLSTGLFETPAEQLRAPDDPTGGVVRPTETPEPPLIVEAEPEMPTDVTSGDDLVILPLDSEIGGARSASEPEPEPDPETAQPAAPATAASATPEETAVRPERAAGVTTQAMPMLTTDPPRRRRGFPWKIVLAVLVVAALTVLGILATRLFETPVYTVPDLVEMPEAEARNLVATNRWELEITRERSDLVPVVGQVVRTAPQAGVDLAEGEPFLIVVSEGPTLRELPESTGLTLPEAQTRLVERGLDVRPPVEEYDEVVPAGTVISWSVPGDATLGVGSMVEPATPVELVVSRGPAPRTIPDVVGQPVGAARNELVALGLTLTETAQEFSDDIVLGSVISQSFEPGTEVERGTDMTVIVSKGPDIVPFPNLSGAATYEDAAEILIEAGFQPRLTFGDTLGEVQQVRIDGEEPIVGKTYRRGTQVDIRAL